MIQNFRNFPGTPVLSTRRGGQQAGVPGLQAQVFELRSLPGASPVEIPRRFSSSSLPPLFVSGRFAVFSFTGGQQVAQEV